jgi:hypothetical protein
MEDNVRLDKDTLAPSNAALVKRAVSICEKHNRSVATWQQARAILRLPLHSYDPSPTWRSADQITAIYGEDGSSHKTGQG